ALIILPFSEPQSHSAASHPVLALVARFPTGWALWRACRGAVPFQALHDAGSHGRSRQVATLGRWHRTGSLRSLLHAPASSPLPGARRFNGHWPRPLPGGEATRGLRTG